MARVIEVTFDCGYQATYSFPRNMAHIWANHKGIYEAMADEAHDRDCDVCNGKETQDDDTTSGVSGTSEVDPEDGPDRLGDEDRSAEA